MSTIIKSNAILPGANFINILRAAFSYKSVLHSFYLLTVQLCNFWQKNIGIKAAPKIDHRKKKIIVKLVYIQGYPY